jgi:hypothetical protein
MRETKLKEEEWLKEGEEALKKRERIEDTRGLEKCKKCVTSFYCTQWIAHYVL